MNPSNSNPTNKPVAKPLTALLKTLTRVLVIILAAIFLGLLLYIGYMLLYEKSIFPTQENTNRLGLVEKGQEQTSQEMAAFQERLTTLEARLNQSNESSAQLKTQQEDLQVQISTQAAALEELDQDSADLQTQLDDTQAKVDEQHELLFGTASPIEELRKDTVVLRVAGLLNRSRLYMLQNDYGSTRQQVELARGLLVELQDSSTASQQGVIASWIGRLDSALNYLPDQPVFAADDLEIAWQMVLQGLPQADSAAQVSPSQSTPTPTPGKSPTATPTITP